MLMLLVPLLRSMSIGLDEKVPCSSTLRSLTDASTAFFATFCWNNERLFLGFVLHLNKDNFRNNNTGPL